MLRTIFATMLIGLFSSGVFAQDDIKGVDAYNAGDYVTALKEWRPLAEQGGAGAQFQSWRDI